MKQTRSISRSVKVTFDIEKLLDVRRELAKRYRARVGVLGQKNGRTQTPDGQTNADIGMVHEFGSVARNIRRRSFLEMPLTLKMPEYAAQFGRELMKAVDEGDLRPAFARLGLMGERVVQSAFATKGFGVWWQNPKTGRGSLIDTAQLRRSITSDVVTK